MRQRFRGPEVAGQLTCHRYFTRDRSGASDRSVTRDRFFEEEEFALIYRANSELRRTTEVVLRGVRKHTILVGTFGIISVGHCRKDIGIDSPPRWARGCIMILVQVSA